MKPYDTTINFKYIYPENSANIENHANKALDLFETKFEPINNRISKVVEKFTKIE